MVNITTDQHTTDAIDSALGTLEDIDVQLRELATQQQLANIIALAGLGSFEAKNLVLHHRIGDVQVLTDAARDALHLGASDAGDAIIDSDDNAAGVPQHSTGFRS